MQKILISQNWLAPDNSSERAKSVNVLFDVESLLKYGKAKIVSIQQLTQPLKERVCLITTVVLEVPDDTH